MKSRTIYLCALFILNALSTSVIEAQSKSQPNVILILADDMGLGDLSILNKGLNKTPVLDSLYKSSAVFENAYSGSAVCTPSRACLLTGLYPHKTGAVTLNLKEFPTMSRVKKSIPTIANYFSDAGYTTGVIGKWHIGDGDAYHPLNRGFDEFVGFKGYDVQEDYYNYKLDIQGQYINVEGEYLTDLITDHTLEYLDQHKDEKFFLHLAHYAPHRPLSAPQELIDFYLDAGISEETATIYAMIEKMDENIGRVLRKLDELGIRDNTIVIFTSDNGPDPVVETRFNLDMKGSKYTIYEGGIHVPFIISHPNIKSKNFNEIIHFTDVIPTLAEWCGLTLNEEIKYDGQSFYSLLTEQDPFEEIPRFWQWNRGVPYYSHNGTMRDGDWKLIYPFITRGMPIGESDASPQLYNLKNDPKEENNLAEEEKKRLQYMMAKYVNWSRIVENQRIQE